MFYQMSPWNSLPIAAPWRQGVCGSLTAVAILAAMWLPTVFAKPAATADAPTEPPTENAPAQFRMASLPSSIAVFSVPRPDQVLLASATAPHAPASSPETPISPSSFRMADGDAFPLVISIPAGPAWRDVFQRYGGAIGVSNSSSPRPAYLNYTIAPDGKVDQESIATNGRFLFRLSDEAIEVVNQTIPAAAKIPPGHSAFGVFEGPFRSVVARVLQDFCATEHVNPDDLTGAQLELGPGFGLRVASATRRAGKL